MVRRGNSPEYVLVEGKNDEHVIRNLCLRHGLSIDVTPPSATGGIDELLVGIPKRLTEPNTRTIGIVVDADVDAAARWQALRARIFDAGYRSIPEEPMLEGWISSESMPKRIGIWIMPNNQLPGMLEDFVRALIAPGDPLLAKVDAIIEEIEREGLRKYSPFHRPKALIHTWLAWQQTPGQPMGQAITAHALQHDTPSALAFVAWLRRLFDLNAAPEVA